MLDNYKLNKLFIFSFIIYLILFCTNQNYSLEDLVLIGFTDQLKYLKIYEAASGLIDVDVAQQQGYRFLFPYIFGKISNLFNIQNEFFLFSAIMIFLNFLIIYFFNKIIIFLKVKKNFSLIIVSALVFNAYMFRPAIINPILINDWLFTYGLILIISFIIFKKENYFYFGLILCAITRQTSQIFNLVFLLIIFYNFIFKKKIKINIYFYGLVINILIFICLSILSSVFTNDDNSNMYFNHIFGIFYFNYSLLDFTLMILRFLNAYLFEFVLLIFLIINFNTCKKFINFETIIIILLGLSVWSQPFLAGPDVTFGNISRLTIISLPIILIFFSYLLKDYEVTSSNTVIIILLLGICSFHHNYTYLLNYFFDYKYYHFSLINFLLNFIILSILIKNNYELKIFK